MIQLIFILSALIGLLMIYWGIKKLLQIYRRKTILESDLSQGSTTFEIEKAGNYSFCFIGGWKISNTNGFYSKITDSTGKSLPLHANFSNYKTHNKSRRIIQYFTFRAEIGRHTIELNGGENVSLKSSLHPFVNVVQSKLPTNSIKFLIQESISTGRFILSLLSLIIGLQVTAWSIVFIVNPNGIS